MRAEWDADLPVRILGAGASGRAAADLAAARGHDVRIFDERKGADPFAGETDGSLRALLWVVSPGFAVDHPWCLRLRGAGAVLLPELEFGARYLAGETLVVTGSLGKTSMVLLMAEMIRATGRTVTVSGNIGKAVSEIALRSPEADVHVIEASSFQLEILKSFAPDRAVCLNLFPNHLDRHGTLEAYAGAKARLFEGMGPEGIAVWPENYPRDIATRASRPAADSVSLPALRGTRFEQGPLRDNLRMMFAAAKGLLDPGREEIRRVVREFVFPRHRMEEIRIPGAGRVIDDSKSTCFSATRAAVEMTSGTLHLFMGGIDKGESPDLLLETFRERNPRLYLFGASGKKMQEDRKSVV